MWAHSDGWQDLNQHGALTYRFDEAPTAPWPSRRRRRGDAASWRWASRTARRGARTLVRSSLADGFDALRAEFLQTWDALGRATAFAAAYRDAGRRGLLSATVLKIHEDRSLSRRGGRQPERSLGQQHRHARRLPPGLAPRCNVDGVRTAGRKPTRRRAPYPGASDRHAAARRALAAELLSRTASPSGPESSWTRPHFRCCLRRSCASSGTAELPGTAQMVRAAVGFIVRTGPSSEQDRWEENPGVSPFTLAVAISALIAAGAVACATRSATMPSAGR